MDAIDRQVMFAEKSWGSYLVLDVEENSMTVKVTLNPGHRMNYHSHDYRDEVWTVVSGTGRTIVDGMEQPVRVGDVITMAAGCRHTVIAETKLQMIEVQLGRNMGVRYSSGWSEYSRRNRRATWSIIGEASGIYRNTSASAYGGKSRASNLD